jgi:hypothetical protein
MVALSPIQPDDERFHPLARIIFHLAGRVAGSFWVKTCHFQVTLVTIPASTMHITRHCLLCRHPLTAETRVRFPVEPPTAAINCHASSPGAAGWRLRWAQSVRSSISSRRSCFCSPVSSAISQSSMGKKCDPSLGAIATAAKYPPFACLRG